MKLTSAITTGALTTLCIFAGACAVGHPVHYYAINVPPAGQTPDKPEGLILVVGHIATPEMLEDARIRYRDGGNEVGSYEYHRWTERPGIMVHDLLVRTLRASGRYQQVQESGSAADGDYLVRGKLYEFAEVDHPQVHTHVALHMELVNRKTGMVAWDHDYNRNEPVSGKNMTEIVVSLEHNMQQVIGEAAAGIEDRLRPERPQQAGGLAH